MSETIVLSSDSSLEDDEILHVSRRGEIPAQIVSSGIPRVRHSHKHKSVKEISFPREGYDQNVNMGTCRESVLSTDDQDFDLQQAIEESLHENSLIPSRRNHTKLPKDLERSSKRRHEKQLRIDTWCKKRKEHEEKQRLPKVAKQSAGESASSPIVISDESSDDDANLPDLDSDGNKNISSLAVAQNQTVVRLVETNNVFKGRSRHFLDGLSVYHLQNNFEEQCQEGRSVHTSSLVLQQRRDRISAEAQAGSSPVNMENVAGKKRHSLSFEKSSESHTGDPSTNRPKDRQLRNGRVKFFLGHPALQTDLLDSLCKEFSHLQVSMIECAIEDQGDTIFLAQILDLLESFSHTHKPPSELVENIIKYGLMSSRHEKLGFHTYSTILMIWHRYPDLVWFDWTRLQIAGDVLKRGLQVQSTDCVKESESRNRNAVGSAQPSFQQAALFLKLMLEGLRLNLKGTRLADSISVRKSLAFNSLSEDQLTYIRRIIHWLECCLVTFESFGCEQSKSTKTSVHQRVKDSQHEESKMCIRLVLGHQEVASWLLESLQSLLSISVLVSEDRPETAKRLSSELLKTYIYLPSLQAKKQLLQTLESPLLCFHLVCLVLENVCNNTIHLNSKFPSSLKELTNCYFESLPPKHSVTPPPSPSDGEDSMEETAAQNSLYSAQSCEELAMLIFFVTKSFFACRQKQEQKQRRKQILSGPNIPSLSSEEKEHLQIQIVEFKQHLQELVPEINMGTYMYLHLMEALTASL